MSWFLLFLLGVRYYVPEEDGQFEANLKLLVSSKSSGRLFGSWLARLSIGQVAKSDSCCSFPFAEGLWDD